MKTKSLVLLVAALAAAASGLAADAPKPDVPVRVTYVDPEKFSDVSDELMASDGCREQVMAELRAEIESQARRYITGGRQLEVKVTDVDLAGGFEPWRGPEFTRIRIMRDVYPPLMKLEFRLLGADGKVFSGGKRELRRVGYLTTTAWPADDPLRYDKENIRAWMRREFGPSA